MRLTVQDIQNSRIPKVVGLCADNLPEIYSYTNEAQQRLIFASGETGFWGGWYKVVFNVASDDSFITTPYDIARLVNLDVCRTPIRVQNEWFEFLWAGAGLQTQCPAENNPCAGFTMEAYERGTVPTQVELDDENQLIRIYYTDSRDIGRKIYFNNALDQNGNGIYTQDGLNSVNGFYLVLDNPFSTTTYIVTSFKNISKPLTYGDVLIYQVDDTTGDEVLLSRIKPSETNPCYRKYFIQNLPQQCCALGITDTAQVTAMAKLEFVPVSRPTDFLIIGNIPALKEEFQSIRYSEVDSPEAKAKSEMHHLAAIRELNRELTHYLGKQQPAINLSVFGTAGLRRQMIGQLL